jgi:hypothetical protein
VRRRHLERALRVLVHGAVAALPVKHRARARKVLSRSEPWRRSPGIQGFGISRRTTKGKQHRDLALKVYVARKRHFKTLKHPVPRTLSIPGIKGRIRTDVEAIGVVRLQAPGDRERPASPGLGLSQPDATSGTFGCVVRRKGSPELYILSNSHVIADSGLAKLGDPINQPSHQHGGGPNDVIAVFEAAVPLTFSATGYPNLADAAIARVLNQADVNPAIKFIGVPRGVSTELRLGMLVQKTGSVTGHTVGTIKDPYFVAALPYKTAGGGASRVGFRDQVLCTRFTDEGDSGALVLNMDVEAVGLHFAGSDSVSIFNRIDTVLATLDLDLVVDAD